MRVFQACDVICSGMGAITDHWNAVGKVFVCLGLPMARLSALDQTLWAVCQQATCHLCLFVSVSCGLAVYLHTGR